MHLMFCLFYFLPLAWSRTHFTASRADAIRVKYFKKKSFFFKKKINK